MDILPSQLSEGALQAAQKFDAVWDPLTRALYGHPKTALGIGFSAGLLVAVGIAFIF